jgi:hypothetical protein
MEINRAASGGIPPDGMQAPTGASGTGPANQRKFVEVLGEGPPSTAPPGQIPDARTGPTPTPAPQEASGVRRTVEGLFKAEQKIDAILNAARSGKTFTAGELLAMQSTVFRYSQTVEIVSRAADRLVGAVKQMLSTQV